MTPSASKNSDDDDDEGNSDEEVSSSVGVPLGDQDAPLSFSIAMQARSWMTAPLTAPMMPEMYGHSNYWQQQQHYAQDDSADMQHVRCSTPFFTIGNEKLQRIVQCYMLLPRTARYACSKLSQIGIVRAGGRRIHLSERQEEEGEWLSKLIGKNYVHF
jgi:hypothetical protein